jgi:hypothetical protein
MALSAATSTARQPSIASCKLCISSSMVSPCVAQPGIAGTSAQKPPLLRLVGHNLDFHIWLPWIEAENTAETLEFEPAFHFTPHPPAAHGD